MPVVTAPVLLRRPFQDERELRSVVHRCHGRMLFQLGHDPAKAFDELTKILVAMAWIEQHGNERLDPQLIRDAYRDSVKNLSNRTKTSEVAQSIDVDDHTLDYICQELGDYSLTETIRDPRGADVTGVVFEGMIGDTFRGNLGEYFTPRLVADFMVDVINPVADDRVIDPACGSGGFLVRALHHSSASGPSSVVGIDINERMVRTSTLNLMLHGAEAPDIRHANGLLLDDRGAYTVCLANPPFAGFESDPDILAMFETGRSRGGRLRSVNKVIPFVEQIIRLLADGGRAGLVLPASVMNAQSEAFIQLRAILLRDTRLDACIGLPDEAFVHTDCGSHGVLLFFTKSRAGSGNGSVFIDSVREIGYDRLGRRSGKSDFPAILERLRRRDPDYLVSVADLENAGRFDPHWWDRDHRALRGRLADRRHDGATELSAYFAVRRELFRPREHVGKSFRYFEVKDAHPETGAIMETHEALTEALPGRVRLIVREGDVLLPNHRDSLMAGRDGRGRSAVVVTPELDGCLTTNRFTVLRPLIEPVVLKHLLNSAPVRRQLLMHARGGASLDVGASALDEVVLSLVIDEELTAELVQTEDEERDLLERLARLRSDRRVRLEAIGD